MLTKPLAIVCACLLAALAFMLWKQDRTMKQLGEERYARKVADGQVIAEQAARAHEQRIAKEASDEYQGKVAALEKDLADRPLGPVVIRVRDRSSVPQADSATSAAAGVSPEAGGRLNAETEIDIATELTAYSVDCQRNTAQLEALISWTEMR